LWIGVSPARVSDGAAPCEHLIPLRLQPSPQFYEGHCDVPCIESGNGYSGYIVNGPYSEV